MLFCGCAHLVHSLLNKLRFVICSFLGNSPASGFLIADVSVLLIGSIFIGRWMKEHITIETRRKLENKKVTFYTAQKTPETVCNL